MEPAVHVSVSQLNENFGFSQWNGYHMCFHCCYCDLECPTTGREMTYYKREGAYRSRLLYEWQIGIQESTKKNWPLLVGQLGEHLDYRQIIHKECLQLMTPDERLLIKERNPNNRHIPPLSSNALITIKDYRLLPHTALCLRCDAVLEAKNQGYAFESLKPERKTFYIHKKCLEIMRRYQEVKK